MPQQQRLELGGGDLVAVVLDELLDAVDEPGAGLERCAAVVGCHCGDECGITDVQDADPVTDGDRTDAVGFCCDFGDDLGKLYPISYEGESDTATFDNAIELLTLAGYPMAQAAMMMIPEAWEQNTLLDDRRRAFYEYHASMMEPWDGPAAMVFTDGRQIGACQIAHDVTERIEEQHRLAEALHADDKTNSTGSNAVEARDGQLYLTPGE